jgi:hypothetical protein
MVSHFFNFVFIKRRKKKSMSLVVKVFVQAPPTKCRKVRVWVFFPCIFDITLLSF